ncbi:MAG: 4-hydroxy-tetrahydrodipicolinate reductase [Bacteroidota bacterium]
MKIILLGYGKMGKEIEKIAVDRKHQIAHKIDVHNKELLNPKDLRKGDIAIDFSTPESAYSNIMTCFEAGIPVVCGTTGWLDKFEEVKKVCLETKQAFFYASNYSLGVNIFFAINKYLAAIMNQFNEYEINMEEIHHTQKLDAPSGTAITLANGIIGEMERFNKWNLDTAQDNETIPIVAIRKNNVPGIHTITYDSEVDLITISHSAKSRKGFALGAVLAAEFILEKQGVFGMEDLLKL